MKVSDFKKKVRRTTEKSFEDLVATAWLEQGLWSRHMSDKFSGVPDRYLIGGRWVELKSLDYARGEVPYGSGLSVEQKRVCGELVARGDEVWYMALITTNKGQYVIFHGMDIVLAQPDNMYHLHDKPADWDAHFAYDGKLSIKKNIPRDWFK